MTKEQIKKTLDEIFKNHNVCISDFEITYDNIVEEFNPPIITTDIKNKKFKELMYMCNLSTNTLSIHTCYEMIYQTESEMDDELNVLAFESLNMYLETFRQLSFFKDTQTCILDKLELVGE